MKMAVDLLARNTRNRKLRSKMVSKYAGAMKRGEWRENGEAIKIAEDGTILDGQHRLEACLESETSFTVLVVSGLPLEAQQTMDGGMRRNPSDRLDFLNEINTTTLAAALRLVLDYEVTGTPRRMSASTALITDQVMLSALERHPGLRDSVNRYDLGLGALTRSQACALHYILSQGPYADKADSFFEHLTTGMMLSADSPILRLRNRLMSMTQQRLGGSACVMALTVKAWNSYVGGRSVKSLRWTDTEEFPEIIGAGVAVLGSATVFGDQD